jgi:hypothetical protein
MRSARRSCPRVIPSRSRIAACIPHCSESRRIKRSGASKRNGACRDIYYFIREATDARLLMPIFSHLKAYVLWKVSARQLYADNL